jgi:hypothetical protein
MSYAGAFHVSSSGPECRIQGDKAGNGAKPYDVTTSERHLRIQSVRTGKPHNISGTVQPYMPAAVSECESTHVNLAFPMTPNQDRTVTTLSKSHTATTT